MLQNNNDAYVENTAIALPLGITSDYLGAVKPYGMFRTFVRSLRQSTNMAEASRELDYKYTPGDSNEQTVKIKSSGRQFNRHSGLRATF